MLGPVDQVKHVGCPWCTRGKAPTWRFDPNVEGGGEYVHVIREKVGEGAEVVTSTICQAWRSANV